MQDLDKMLSKQIELPDNVWKSLNISWGGFFAIIGVINLYVVYNYSTDVWVNFKLFGIMALMIIFLVVQSILFAKYIPEKNM